MSSDSVPNDTDSREDLPFAGQAFSESIDTALATVQEMQMELSHMADSKANIMITVSSILLTLAIGKIEQGSLVLPSVCFALFCVPALTFSILCVMPAPATGQKPIGKDGKLPHFNPLFFMHFTLLPIKHFETEISRVLTSPQELYQRLSRDIYHQGMVLRVKKYRYLRWSYQSLLMGVAVGCLALLFEAASRF